MHTLIFGGSFNPLHNGHVALCRYVLQEQLAEEVWLMVSPQNPLKAASSLAPEALRFRWAQAAEMEVEGVRACNFEFQLPRPSYTYKTLEALRRTFPERRFSLLIGADNWHAFPRWRANEELLRTTDIYVYPRQSYDIDAASLPPRVHLTAAPLYPISSTDIRLRAAKGESIAGLLPKSIEEEVRAYYRANMLKV